MPMMIVSEEEFEREKASYDRPTISRVPINRGRGKDSNEVPAPLREVIAEDAIVSGGNELATALGVSESSNSAYKHGVTSLAKYNGKKDVTARERISNKALNKTLAALNQITSEKMRGVDKLKDLTSIAKDLAIITDKLSPAVKKNDLDDKQQLNVVIYAPQMRSLSDYKMIDDNGETVDQDGNVVAVNE